MINREDFLVKNETNDNYIITDQNGKNEHSVLKIDAAVGTIYLNKENKEMIALKDREGKVYLGNRDNYYSTPFNSELEPIAFYDNSDNSLEFISNNEQIFDILSEQNFRKMDEIASDNYYDKDAIDEWNNVEYKFNKYTKENINYEYYAKSKELDEEENMDKKNATDFTPLNKVLTGNRGLSQDEIDIIRRNINRKAEYLDGYKNLPDEDKQEDCELNLREMIMSCLVYGSDPKNNKYVKPYYDKLEKDTVDKIIKDQTEYFERGEVVSAGQDSEENSYNSFLDPKTVKPLFYGVPNVYMISHGEWADPELEYKDHLFNYYDLENLLNEEYEECKNSGEIDKNISFEKYVKDNQNYIYDCLDTQIEADLENRNEEIYGNLNKTNLQKAFNYIKEILNTQNNDTERDGFYYPEKAVELVELNSKIIISPFFDFTTSDELELINNNTTVEEAIDSLFDKDSPYSEEHARVYGNNFTSCLNKIANKELHLSNEDEESEER